MQSEDEKKDEQDTANNIILCSQRGWLMHMLEVATDFKADLIPDAKYAICEHWYEMPIRLRHGFYDSCKPIDLRGDVPKQLGIQLRIMAKQLELMAVQAEAVPSELYEHKPKAYVTKDADTGEVIGVRLLLSQSAPLGTSYDEIMNADSCTRPEDVTNWPELGEQVKNLMRMADGSEFDFTSAE